MPMTIIGVIELIGAIASIIGLFIAVNGIIYKKKNNR